MISLLADIRIRIAGGVADIRRDFHGLSAQVQTMFPPQRRRPAAGTPALPTALRSLRPSRQMTAARCLRATAVLGRVEFTRSRSG